MSRATTSGLKLAGAAATVLLTLAVPSRADALELGTPEQEHPFRSAQNFALELRFGPYRPNVDDEPGLSGRPYEGAFGASQRLMLGIELDWQMFRIPHVGTLGPGLGIGYTAASSEVQTVTGRASGDETRFSVIPMWGVAVLRADVLWRELGLPLVPYGKVGLAAGMWRATNSGGTSEVNGVSGKGVTFGTKLAAGVMIALDGLDPDAARNMDAATGINGTYLFAEFYSLGLTGLGQSAPLYVGADTWTAGLAFEL